MGFGRTDPKNVLEKRQQMAFTVHTGKVIVSQLLAKDSVARIAESLPPFHMSTETPMVHLPGAKANTAKHSPVEATAVTTERRLSK